MTAAEEFVFWAALALAAALLFINARANARARRERADAKLVALIQDALDRADDTPPAEDLTYQYQAMCFERWEKSL